MKIIADIHTHTYLSSCASREASVEAHVKSAKSCGLSVLGFSDHLWDSNVPGASNWYAPQNVEHVLELKSMLPKDRVIDGVKILYGCETEFTHKSSVFTRKMPRFSTTSSCPTLIRIWALWCQKIGLQPLNFTQNTLWIASWRSSITQ